MIFTEKKFNELDLQKQHKKCAELIREIYEEVLRGNLQHEKLKQYNTQAKWLSIPQIENFDLKTLSNTYHLHLSKANLTLKEHNLLPEIRRTDRLTEKEGFQDNCIYLDQVRSAYNVGNILRTAEALRIGKIYFSKNTPFINNHKVIKTSMGAYEFIPCYNEAELKDLPRPFIGLDTSDEAIPVYDFIFPKRFTLLLGNEEFGLSDSSLKEIDYLLEIPMLGRKNSMNIASAFAITAGLIRKQLSH
ncbi:MAG TPA: TrmH family RNA methyltransferase [Chlamydiales bacterium]|nr:TrmH family RNA methyltransferase [Chlamydiales bacterium]